MDPKAAPPFAKDGAHPEIDSLVYDTDRRLAGTVVGIGCRVTLRPLGGGVSGSRRGRT